MSRRAGVPFANASAWGRRGGVDCQRGGHMKRSLLGIAAAGILVLAACGDDDDDASTDATTGGDTEAPAPTDAPAGHAPRPAATDAPADTTAPADTGGGDTTAPDGTEPAPGGGPSNIQASGECGLGTGEPATGEPIKIGAMATNIPASTSRGSRAWRAPTSTASTTTAGSTAGRSSTSPRRSRSTPQQIASLATKLIEQDQVRRHRRQHQPDRVQRQPRLLRRAGVLPDHRRRRPGLLHEPELLGRQHGPVLLEPRRRPGGRAMPAPRASSSSSRRTSPAST